MRHSYLIIFRFNLGDDDPIRCGTLDAQGRFTRLKSGKASLVVGVVDATRKAATTPLSIIDLSNKKSEKYNKILGFIENLNSSYRRADGYFSDPAKFNTYAQRDVYRQILEIGGEIFDLIKDDRNRNVSDWLSALFRGTHDQSPNHSAEHLTIVTNDLSIPWYWLRFDNRFLCEIASLGLLQLTSYPDVRDFPADPRWRYSHPDQIHRALVIDADPEASGDLDTTGALSRGFSAEIPEDNSRHPVNIQMLDVKGTACDARIKDMSRGSRVEEFRLVHYCGEFTAETLKKLIEAWGGYLEEIMARSLVVLDGCNAGDGLHGWTDIDNLAKMLSEQSGAGCVLPVLPVKHDPIIADVLWSSFYAALRTPDVSVGEALRRARIAVKEHGEDVSRENPVWLFHQLIGNPSVEVFRDRQEDRRGP